ncbi:MAG: thioredoxin family protein [Bdellovibrionota bacterium]
MALTYSEMVPLGKSAPKFELMGIDGKWHALEDFKGKKALVVMFICKHCPYVIAVQDRLAALAREFSPKGVQFVGINSNDTEKYPEDSPENMKLQAEEVGFSFPYLIDETQEVAKAYGAVCTPDIFVFDQDLKLRYRGRIDDNWKDPAKVTKQDLKLALEAMLQGQPVGENQIPSMGCSIKFKHNGHSE